MADGQIENWKTENEAGFFQESSCHGGIKNVPGEPLTNWQPVEDTGIPGWRKEFLPEEEVEMPTDLVTTNTSQG